METPGRFGGSRRRNGGKHLGGPMGMAVIDAFVFASSHHAKIMGTVFTFH